MSKINGVGSVTPGGLPAVARNDDSGLETAQTFSAAYELALANASLSQEAATAANSLSSANGSRHIPLAGQQQENDEGLHEVALAACRT